MKKNKLPSNYWEDRYLNSNIGWDIGFVSTPIKSYIDQLTDKTLKILIPGAGNSYEAEYLWRNGFKNIFIVDIAKSPITNFLKRVPDFPKAQCLNQDFFDLNTSFDLIIEQTFFCALDPNLRSKYVEKMDNLLHAKGKLVGLLFDFELTDKGPPFGGHKAMYRELFENKLNIKILETSYNSIEPRKDKELFFIFEKNTLWSLQKIQY